MQLGIKIHRISIYLVGYQSKLGPQDEMIVDVLCIFPMADVNAVIRASLDPGMR